MIPKWWTIFKTLKNVLGNLININKISTNKTLQVPRIINAKRQPPNVLRSLALKHKSSESNKERDFKRCKDPRCLFCKQVIADNSYRTTNGTILKRNKPMTCKSRDVMYYLVCSNCKAGYIGETGIPLNLRTNIHRNHTNSPKNRKLQCNEHFQTCASGNFNIFPFLKFRERNHYLRKSMEKHFRNIVKPTLH